MQFTYPAFLWALSAILVPIIIHLFNFRKYKTVYFSNVRFLKDVKKETKSKATLKNILLLIARILVIAFLVFAFSKPYIPEKGIDKKATKDLVVVYIDNSFSMEAEGKYGMLLENAKLNASKIIDAFNFNTDFILLTNNLEKQHARIVGREQFVDWVSQIEATHEFRPINDIFEKVQTLLQKEKQNYNIQYFLISDFQETVFNANLISLNNSRVYTIRLDNLQKNNLYIDSVWFETPGHYIGKHEKILASIVNASNSDYFEIPVSLVINDSLKNTVSINIDANTDKIVELPFVQWNPGESFAKIEIDDFPVTFDNDYFMNWNIKDKINILLINDKESSNYLEVLYQKDDNFNLYVESVYSINYNKLADYQLIILNEIENISSGLISALNTYISESGQLLFIPSENGNIDDYNAFLKESNQVQILTWLKEKGAISKINQNNNLFDETLKGNLDKVKYPDYSGYFRLEKKKKSFVSPIIYNEQGHELFYDIPFGNGNVFVSALPLQTKTTNFVTHPLFVALYYNIALFSNKQENKSYWLDPQMVIAVKVPFDNSLPIELSKLNDGTTLMTPFNYQFGQLRLFPEIKVLNNGVYKVKAGGDILSYVSLNYSRIESELKYYSNQELEEQLSRLGISNHESLSSNSNYVINTLKSANAKSDLSMLMLWMALGFLLFEMLVIRFIMK